MKPNFLPGASRLLLLDGGAASSSLSTSSRRTDAEIPLFSALMLLSSKVFFNVATKSKSGEKSFDLEH